MEEDVLQRRAPDEGREGLGAGPRHGAGCRVAVVGVDEDAVGQDLQAVADPLERARRDGMSLPLQDRLTLTPERIADIADAMAPRRTVKIEAVPA